MELEQKLAELKTALEKSTDDKVKAGIAAEIKSLEEKMADVATIKTDLSEIKAWQVTKDEADRKNQELLDQIAIKMKDKNFGNEAKADAFAVELKEKKETLRQMVKNGSGEIEIKADTLRSSIATNVHQLVLPDIGQLGVKRPGIYDIFPKLAVSSGNHNGNIAYVDWDEDTIARAADMRAEGAAFPESTAKFKGYTLPIRKIGDTLPVSEEFMEDEVTAAAELTMFVNVNVNSKRDDQLVNGDNTGQNLKGLLTSIDAYTAAASSITDANIYDLIVKCKESISKTRGSKYQPNFAAMNQTMINQLVLKKDANNQYLFPPNHPIYSMIVEDNNIADNVMVVGDSRFGRIYEMGGLLIEVGRTGTDFTDDMKTIKAKKRLALLIRAADKTGFTKVTDVAAALTTLAS